MKIGIDIDGTICNSIELIHSYALKYIKENKINYDIEDNFSFNEVEKLFQINNEVTNKILINVHKKIESNKYEDLKVIYKSNDVINKLKEEGHKIYFITRRSNNDFWQDAYSTTKKFLNHYNFKYDELITAAFKKGEICKNLKIDIFIDDQSDNCQNLNENNIQTILLNKFYNKNYKNKLNTRLDNWEEIYNYINKISKLKF